MPLVNGAPATTAPDKNAMQNKTSLNALEHNNQSLNAGIEAGTDLGTIQVHHDVIAHIARQAALKVAGVVDISSSFSGGIAGLITKNASERGIKIETEANNVTLLLSLIVEYGARIPRLAWSVQNEVRRAIEDMTGKHVLAVNLVIQGVKSPPSKQQEGATE